MERSLNTNTRVESVQTPGSCSEQSCLCRRDWAPEEHHQGRRWAEWQSTSWGCRPRCRKPAWQAGHSKGQKPSPHTQVFPKTSPRKVSHLGAGLTAEHRGGTLTVWGSLPHPKFCEGISDAIGVKMWPEGSQRFRVPNGMFKTTEGFDCVVTFFWHGTGEVFLRSLCFWSAGLLSFGWGIIVFLLLLTARKRHSVHPQEVHRTSWHKCWGSPSRLISSYFAALISVSPRFLHLYSSTPYTFASHLKSFSKGAEQWKQWVYK